MIDVTVVRFTGDKPGEDIIDPLLSTEAAAIARGRAELNKRSLSEQRRIYDVDFRTGIRKGQVVEVFDEAAGKLVRGKISEIQIAGRYSDSPGNLDTELTMRLTLLVPTDFFR